MNRCTSGGIAAVSLTARASASVTAPRRPPHRMTTLYLLSTRWLRPTPLRSGMSPHSTTARARQRRDDEHEQADQIRPADVEQQLRHHQRRQDEDERAGPERELLPQIVQEAPICRRDLRLAERAQHEARRDRGHDARHIEPVLSDDEDDVGQREGQRHLRGPEVAQPRQQRDRRRARQSGRSRRRRRASARTRRPSPRRCDGRRAATREGRRRA